MVDINDYGDMIGTGYNSVGKHYTGYLIDENGVTEIHDPDFDNKGVWNNGVWGFNNVGDIVGGSWRAIDIDKNIGEEHVFHYNDGKYTVIDGPEGLYGLDINDGGVIAARWHENHVGKSATILDGVYSPINHKSYEHTLVDGILNSGEVFGHAYSWLDDGSLVSSWFVTSGDDFIPLLVGKSNQYFVVDINDIGQVIGGVNNKGFIYTPDTAHSTVSYELRNNFIDNLTLEGVADIDGMGNARVNTIVGNSAANSLFGGAGADRLFGGDGDDLLRGDSGADYLSGGLGLDTATYESTNTGLIVSLADPTLNTKDAAGDTYASIQNLIGSGFNDWLEGDKGSNKIESGDGNDTVIGGAGEDKLYGGAGDDTASYLSAIAGVTADLSTPSNNRGDAKGDTFESIENLRGSLFNDRLAGDKSANYLRGEDGDDVLDGGAGPDKLYGGTGNDVASYASASSAVLASLLAPNNNSKDAAGDIYNSIEGLIGSIYADTLIGNNSVSNILDGYEGNDVIVGMGGIDSIFGGGGDDLLVGGTGWDNLYGGKGSDTASYFYATSGLTVSLLMPSANTGEAYSDYFVDIENLTGGAHNDRLEGNGLGNILDGQAGNDLLTGGAGADKIFGGTGVDATTYATALAGVTARLSSSALNLGDAKGDTYLEVENVIGSAFDDILEGTKSGNILWGGDGSDILIGGSAADKLSGGTGSDWASYETAAKGLIVSLIDPKNNTGDASGDIYESIDSLIGSAFDDRIFGNNSSNGIRGGGGNDLIFGLAGNDLLFGGEGADQLAGDVGNDTLEGGHERDRLLGGSGSDTASYSGAGSGVTVDLANPINNTGDALGVWSRSVMVHYRF